MSEKQSKEELAAKQQAAARSADPKGAAATKRPAPSAQAATNPSAAKADARATAKAAEAQAEPDEDEEIDEPSQSFFNRSVRWMSTAGGISLVVHMAVLIIMGLAVMHIAPKPVKTELVSTEPERMDDVVQEVLEKEIEPTKELALESTSTSAVTGAMGAVSAMSEPQMEAPTVTDTTPTVNVNVGEVNVFASTGTQLSSDLPEGTLGEAGAISDSIADAMDRITAEVLARLARGPVLVVWCMDQSESMNDDRMEIMSRIGRVYEELGLAKEAQGNALLTAVMSYGEKTAIHTNTPTSNVDEIVAAMGAVPNDPSGMEVMCPAIGFGISNFRKYATGNRQMMLITVTDESGDPTSNNQYLEATIAEAKAARCPLYFLGREAVFGYPFALMTWKDPGNGRTLHLQIERGPETPFPEQLQFDGLNRRNDAHASGFGPYEQTRMARQTGGIFFMLPSPETNLYRKDNTKYALEAMRPYLPDLSSRADYAAERDKYDLRRIVWKVISDLNPYDPNMKKIIEIQGGFPLEKAKFDKAAMTEINDVRALIGYIKEAQNALESVRPLRDRESSVRWRANYDIIYAQLLAYEVRLHEYVAYLESFMHNPKPVTNKFGETRKTTSWQHHQVARMLTGDQYKPQLDKAMALFKQITVEHAGTPWATRAAWEMKRPYGMELVEHHQGVPRPGGTKPPKL